MEHMEIKISQPIFGILVVLTKNELTKLCNEPSINSRFYCLGFNQDPPNGIAFEEFKHVHTQQKYDDRWRYVRKTVFFAFLHAKKRTKNC